MQMQENVTDPKPVVINTDASMISNPGICAYGCVVTYPDGHKVKFGGWLGETTNNVGEYGGVIAALWYAVNEGLPNVEIRTDALIVANRLNGKWRRFSRVYHIQALIRQASQLMAKIPKISVVWVPREQNTEADKQSRVALRSRIRQGVR